MQTFGQNLGRSIAQDEAVGDLSQGMGAMAQDVGIGIISGAITSEIINGLDWNQEWSSVASGVSNAYISNALSGSAASDPLNVYVQKIAQSQKQSMFKLCG